MSDHNEIIGLRFGRLTVIEYAGKSKDWRPQYKCECDCGNTTIADLYHLKNGDKKSCGCLRRQLREDNPRFKHGQRNTRLYRVWKGMNARCRAKDNDRYGGRGIKVCEEWQRFEPFRDWALANGYADDLSIDRINNDGNYEPANCRWATNTEQGRNRSSTIMVTVNGEEKPLAEWCEIFGADYKASQYRYYKGFSGIDIFENQQRRQSHEPVPTQA